MGDRVSVSFKTKKYNDESVALFNHWGGHEFALLAQQFVDELKQKAKDEAKNKPHVSTPFTRIEPCYLMVLFIAWLSEHDELNDSLYLGKDQNDGDNSDNGHFTIEVEDQSNAKL